MDHILPFFAFILNYLDMKHITGRSGKHSGTVENGFLELYNVIDCNFFQRRFNIKDRREGPVAVY